MEETRMMKDENVWEIQDNNGTIHSGTQEDMEWAWDIMLCPGDFHGEDVDEWYTTWEGDLKLVEVHNIYR